MPKAKKKAQGKAKVDFSHYLETFLMSDDFKEIRTHLVSAWRESLLVVSTGLDVAKEKLVDSPLLESHPYLILALQNLENMMQKGELLLSAFLPVSKEKDALRHVVDYLKTEADSLLKGRMSKEAKIKLETIADILSILEGTQKPSSKKRVAKKPKKRSTKAK